MKTAVYTVCDNKTFELFRNLSIRNLKNYANKIGADFIVYGEDEYYAQYERSKSNIDLFKWGVNYKFKNLKKLFDTYDRILVIDCDFIITNSAPNIFHIVPPDKIGLFNEADTNGDFIFYEESIVRPFDTYNNILIKNNKPIITNPWNNKYYNNGLIVASRETKEVWQEPIEYFDSLLHIQDYTNLLFRIDPTIEIQDLTEDYNYFVIKHPDFNENLKTSFFIHFAACGNYNSRYEMMDKYYKYLRYFDIVD